tara:strand:+ start:240 stop:599 length:360 start_codon:yes stop_codon:yes gene_type:complete
MKCNFDKAVYSAVLCIPFAKVATYGQIAELIGAYGYSRQVGWSLRRLVLSSSVPWHRVINSKGKISMTISRDGSDWIQIMLLKEEGIFIDKEFKVNLKKYKWRPELTENLKLNLLNTHI